MVCLRGESLTTHTKIMELKTGLVGALLGLLGASCMATTPANSTIWADLDAKEVSGKNDGIDNLWVTKAGRTQRLRNPNAAMPLKGKTKSAPLETAKMTAEGEKYYSKIFSNDIAREKAFSLSEKNQAKGWATRTSGGCPPGTSHYRTKGLFGLGARDIGCMTAYEAESLRRQNHQNFQNNLNRNRMRNCTTNFISSTAYTNCY